MRMLIVDDDPTVVDFFCQAAALIGGTEVDTAYSGEEALGLVVRNTYDLITLDIRMPGASGLEIIAPLRNMCPHAIIAVISGHIPDSSSLELAGCADVVIPKPIDLKTFKHLLNGARKIYDIMQEIRTLGQGPVLS